VKIIFARCGGLVPPPLSNMEVLAHISNAQIEYVAMETSNPSVERKFVSTSRMEGANFNPLQTT
jgi:hypothetical protein